MAPGYNPIRYDRQRTAGRDINLEILRVEGCRKFCNKIFNATKFAMLKLDQSFIPEATPQVRTVPRTEYVTDFLLTAHWQRNSC